MFDDDDVIFVILMTIIVDLVVLAMSGKLTIDDFVYILPTIFVMVSTAHFLSMNAMCIKGV